MGKSTASCFKIIACGGGSTESVDRDDLDASSENKVSDKRGWSFRKRSARHRVLSNTVVTEIPSSENKESSEPAFVNSQAPVNSAVTVSEKTSGTQWTEEIPRLSTSTTKGAAVSTVVAKNVVEDDIKCDTNQNESVIIVIQAAVRGFLARRELLKQKNVIKLQAAVRGHLVRNHAVGTLRCVQAIVKMQGLVRARHVNTYSEEKGAQNLVTKSRPTYISIEKLLSNKFARQLLESTPKRKQINIKCDPSRSDSAWKWLERWMSVSSPEPVESHAPEQEQDRVKDPDDKVDVVLSLCESTIMDSDVKEAAVPSEGKENLIKSEANTSSISHEEKPQPPNTCMPDSKENSDILSDEVTHLNAGAEIEVNSISEKPASQTEQPKRSAKRLATEQADSEGRKSVFGSRKASNPAFIAAQSRFEELASKSSSLKSVDSSNLDNVVDSPADTGSSAPENATHPTDVEPVESLVPHSSKVVQIGGSECGTELSVTSTLDSPDQSEVENMEFEKEAKVLDEEAADTKSRSNIEVEEHALLGTELTYSISALPGKHDGVDGAASGQLTPANSADISEVEQKLEENTSDAHIELEPVTGHPVYKSNTNTVLEPEPGHQVYKSSPENSPRSHITVPESQGTPSSQVSTNNKKTRSDKNVGSQKRKSWSNSKKSPVSSGLDSGLRNSLEHLPKDPKPGKRRNSFGSPRPDHIDQEPRDSSSSNSLPSYMQATESARAKALANGSPKSSPDVQDKEIYVKKRHSLPGGVNGRQGSPRIQRSMSQAQQSTKANGSQERKWQR